MPQIAIVVEFEIQPGQQAAFEAVIREHARRTKADEPGCLRFEVLQMLDDEGRRVPDKMMVNELYSDLDAVAAHRGTPRMAEVGAQIGKLISSRRLVMAEVEG